MFNNDTKQAFLEAYTPSGDEAVFSRVGHVKKMMQKIEPSEDKIGKDLGEMTAAEIFQAIGMMGAPNYIRVWYYIRYVRQYLAWYSEHIKPNDVVLGRRAWAEVDLAPYFSVAMVRSPTQIVSDWRDFKPEDGHYVQIIYILMWYGMDILDAIQLQNADVVFENDEVAIQGTDIHITDPLCVRALWDFRHFTETLDRKWHRPDVETFLFRRIKAGDPDEKGLLTTVLVYNRLQILKVSDKRPGYQERYESSNFKYAGAYYRVIELENQNGRPATNEEIKRILQMDNTDQRWHIDTARLSIQKYREAFDL